MKVVNRQMKIVVAIFLLPIVFLLVENGISGGTADKNGDILWIYLPLIPLCTIALINMQLRKRNIIKRAKEEAER
jgi:bacteriorhodopsin